MRRVGRTFVIGLLFLILKSDKKFIMSLTRKDLETMSLAQLPIGKAGRIVSIDGASKLARRMMEMGLVPGAPIRVIKTAPLGDPLEISVHRYRLALRRTEAQAIQVAHHQD